MGEHNEGNIKTNRHELKKKKVRELVESLEVKTSRMTIR